MALSHVEFYAERDAATENNPTLDILTVAWGAGDRVYVYVSGRDGASVVSGVAATGLTFTLVEAEPDTQGAIWAEVWESDIAAGSDTQTVTVSITATGFDGGLQGSAFVVSGNSPTTDAHAGANTGAADDDTPTVDVTTTAAVTRLYYGIQHRNVTTCTFDAGDALTDIRNNDQVGAGGAIAGYSIAYKDVSSSGTYNGSATLSVVRDWVMIGWSVTEAGEAACEDAFQADAFQNDAFQICAEGGTLVERTAADSLSLSDAPVRVGTFLRTTADSLSLGNTVARVGTFLRSNADSLSLGNTVARVGTFARTAGDTLSFGNTVARVLVLGRTAADTLGIADSVARVGTFLRTAADGLTISEAVAAIRLIVRTLDDALGISDTVARVGTFVRTTADSVSFGDTIARAGTFVRAIDDSLGFSDTVTRIGTFLRTAADALNIADVVEAIVTSPANLVRTVADTISIMDNVVRSGGFTRTASDTLDIAQTVFQQLVAGVTGGFAPIGRAFASAASNIASHLRPGGGASGSTPTGKAEHPKPKD